VEEYPYLLTYPLGKPFLFDKSSFEDVAKGLNLVLVLVHSKAKLFHGDISPKNIVMHCNKPVLIDWAYAIQKGQVLAGFTGTMTFASITVTRLREQIQDYEYRARDDFESLFYTLLYLASENYLPWLNKKDLSATELADAKKLAVADNWSETKRHMKDVIPFLDVMRQIIRR
jgi:serine/threonine protein kinase